MHGFEAAVFGKEGCSEMTLVAAFAFERHVFECYVANFKNFDGDAVVFVFSKSLEEAGQEGCADDLVFCRFRISQSDGRRAVVDAIQVGEILSV